MTVAGYNHIPDVNDHEPVIGVDYEKGLTTATVYIAQEYCQEEIEMTVEELEALNTQIQATIAQMKGDH